MGLVGARTFLPLTISKAYVIKALPMQLMERDKKDMRELLSKVSSKGQVTIPIEVRRLLGVQPEDKVAFVVEEGNVQLKRTGSVVDRTAGALKSHEPPLSAKQLREAAEEAIAQDVVERMGG